MIHERNGFDAGFDPEFGPFGGHQTQRGPGHHGGPRGRATGAFDGFGGLGGFRAGRGMVEPAILHVLSQKPMHGYEIISTLEEESHGIWRPSAGSIYPTLQLLEEKGLLESTDEDGKKVYHLTEAGKTEAESNSQEPWTTWQNRAEKMRDIRGMHGDLSRMAGIMRTIWRKGTDTQKHALIEALHAFRDRLNDIAKEENL